MRGRRIPISIRLPMASKVVPTTARTAKHIAPSSLSRSALHLLLYNYESSLHFVQHRCKVHCQQRLLRINHHIHRPRLRHPRQPHRFPQPPLHAIPHHRPAQRLAHSKSHARPWIYRVVSRWLCGRPRPIENGHRRREMPPPLLVNPFKICVAQQSSAPRETNLLPPRLRSIRLFLGSDSAHGDGLVEFPDRDILFEKKRKANRRSQPTSRDNRAQRSSANPCVPVVKL
jgi:hypothetical protein